MCAIVGIVERSRRVDPRLLEEAAVRMSHRGPDDCGVHVHGHVGLSHRRLSIVDRTSRGRQPMANEDESIWIVVNGEIYNHEELRNQHCGGHSFRSACDAEVVLHLYEEYGTRCISLLRGMFAIGIWDDRAKRLVLARDRLGKKPLYYALSAERIVFASEIKGILATGPHVADPVAVHQYLALQYVPGPDTAFRGIRRLLPGHLLIYENGRATEQRYWTLHYEPKIRRTDRECAAQFSSLLRDCVGVRLGGDAAVGAMLSGGIDSSSVVAIMCDTLRRPVPTFTVGFDEDGFDEREFARGVAEHCQTEHHEVMVGPGCLEDLPSLVRAYDEPFADSAAIPTYYLARYARSFVTVLLNGDGGDEILAGYPRYDIPVLRAVLQRLWPALESCGADFLGGVAARSASPLDDWPCGVVGVRRDVRDALVPLALTYLRRISIYTPEQQQWLYTADFAAAMRGHEAWRLVNRWLTVSDAREGFDRLMAIDLQSNLPDALLVKVDRASMAFGLECRSPFLDHRLVEFAAAMPSNLKVRGGRRKAVLRQAMEGHLPSAVLDRRKQGFGVPISQWCRREWRACLRDTLLSGRACTRGYFRPERIEALIEAHESERVDCGEHLYALLMLELWHREYVDARG